jgi:hypothetical protein
VRQAVAASVAAASAANTPGSAGCDRAGSCGSLSGQVGSIIGVSPLPFNLGRSSAVPGYAAELAAAARSRLDAALIAEALTFDMVDQALRVAEEAPAQQPARVGLSGGGAPLQAEMSGQHGKVGAHGDAAGSDAGVDVEQRDSARSAGGCGCSVM